MLVRPPAPYVQSTMPRVVNACAANSNYFLDSQRRLSSSKSDHDASLTKSKAILGKKKFLQAMKSKTKKKSSIASKVASSHGVQESAGEKKTERSLNGYTPLEAYNICSVEECFEEVSGPGECCTGSWCDADNGICYTDVSTMILVN